jgi:hypothetical protein
MTATATTGYAGWHRRDKSGWQKLTEDLPTERDAWRVLLDVTSELPGKGGDSVVLPAGRKPG